MSRLILLNVFLAVFIFITCSNIINSSMEIKAPIEVDTPMVIINQKILFEVEHINFAWGWMHYGSYIDNSGRLYSYSYLNVDYEDRWNPQRNGIYTESELFEKYSHSKEFVKQIDYNELTQMANLIPAASNGILSDPVGVMCDAGLLTYKGYLYDESKNEYIEVILRVSGDDFFENLSPAAKIIADWLISQRE